MKETGIFEERYRVVAVDDQSLVLRGIHSGEVLTILNADGAIPLTEEDYPVGKLIALDDPSSIEDLN
jgi:hypothetical protein